MTRLTIAFLAVTLMLAGCASTQDKASADGTVEKENQIYIPKDLEDCFVQLKKLLKPEDIQRMKSGTEDDMIEYHFGLGMWMRNNWGLWGGSRLAVTTTDHSTKKEQKYRNIRNQ